MVLRTFNFWGFCGPYRESPYYSLCRKVLTKWLNLKIENNYFVILSLKLITNFSTSNSESTSLSVKILSSVEHASGEQMFQNKSTYSIILLIPMSRYLTVETCRLKRSTTSLSLMLNSPLSFTNVRIPWNESSILMKGKLNVSRKHKIARQKTPLSRVLTSLIFPLIAKPLISNSLFR